MERTFLERGNGKKMCNKHDIHKLEAEEEGKNDANACNMRRVWVHIRIESGKLALS